MSTNSGRETPEERQRRETFETEDAIGRQQVHDGMTAERRRIIGTILAEYGVYKLAGDEKAAQVCDRLATKIEHELD
jgi:hypothetical protein